MTALESCYPLRQSTTNFCLLNRSLKLLVKQKSKVVLIWKQATKMESYLVPDGLLLSLKPAVFLQ
jgi:hypothetical protein